MDPVIKKSWINNLRSGRYLQGTGFLRCSNGDDVFCCLGVLQDQVAPEEWMNPDDAGIGENTWAVPHPLDLDPYGSQDNEGELSPTLLALVGITNAQQTTLMGLNDGKRWSSVHSSEGRTQSTLNPEYCAKHEPQDFNAIADWIEENL
jgi:hypothetical protein